MKKLLKSSSVLIRHGILGLLFTNGALLSYGQTTYYVANSGNDANTGTSAGVPFQTLAKVNSLALQPGDRVLFQRGDTFRGSLQIRQSGSVNQPISIDAYGSGNKPVLSGAVIISNWTNIGNNVWQADCPACGSQVTGVYRNNSSLPLGRYPNLNASNKGYLTVQSHAGNAQITSQQSLPMNFTGGEAVIRPVQWIINRATITQQQGNSLSINYNSGYQPTDNWGFFIQKHPATLDQTGEWYYDAATKTIRLYDDQSNPNTQQITATAFAEAVKLLGVNFVTLRNLQLTQTLNTGLLADNSANLTVSDAEITNAGEDGMTIAGSGTNVLVENCRIEDVNNNGFTIGQYQNFTFRGNTIQRIGLLPGRGKNDDGTYIAFQSFSTANALIENNVVENVGYNGINFSTNSTVERNRIANYCLTKSDGGGLYIWNGNKQAMNGIRILSNVVYNGIGAPEGTPGGAYSGANGIYLDDCTTNIEVANNAVFNCRGLGIYLHGSSNVSVTKNTVYNNGEGQLAITDIPGACSPRNNVVQSNIFVSRLSNQFNVKYESNQDDLSSFGQFADNVYARPLEDVYKIRAVYKSGDKLVGADLSLAQWQSKYGKDMNSKNSPVTSKNNSANPDDYIKFLYNETGNANQVSLDGTYRDARNNVYSGQIEVPAFSALVLLKPTADAPAAPLREPENPTNVVAGLNYSYYEGSWNALPNFNAMTPMKTGTVANADVSIRNRDSQYSINYTGFINVPADGQYTFYTSSDDGSKLYIGTTEVVNNDGLHGEQERSGTIGLKAGKHALTIGFLQGGGGQVLILRYSGPGFDKQDIPSSAFYRIASEQPPAGTGTGTGLRAEYYNNISLGGTPVLTRTDATVNFDWGTGSPASGVINTDNFSVRWTGQVQAPVTGNYVFSTTTDDGVRLWVNGVQVINDWNGHAPTTNNSVSIALTANQKYTIQLEYFEGSIGAVAKLLWSYSGQAQQIVPQGRLFPAVTPERAAVSNNVTYLSDLSWVSMNNGYGPAEKDRSNGESGSSDGRSIILNGVAYAKGLGVHAASDITYNLDGRYTTFVTDIGIDDEIGSGCGSVEFQVYVDNVLVYNSGRMDPTTATKSVSLDVSGKRTLRLVVTDGGDNSMCDHADWAGARLIGSGSGRVAAAEELSPESTLQVYPIPARDELKIRYHTHVASNVMVQLVNGAAQSVIWLSQPAMQGENLIKLPVSNLQRGVYVLNLIQGNRRTTRKIILAE
ncbi:NPCBM/NEW2 domain-containing protein [Spirosoma soli]|uniref:NPCBM/NEW2 domain-containing protein n=1 Tax=Spirosoma soli TaxID=1770529 RepID=A0ABW5MC99_9BACT